jgi:Tol biopolymer transport system component
LRRIHLAAAAAVLMLVTVIGITTGGGGGGSDSSSAPATTSGPARTNSAGSGSHGEHSDIYLADAQSGHVHRLTDYTNAVQPTWAPDHRIAYSAADCDECYSHLFYVDRKGIDQRLVRAGVRHLFHPAWSPDGESLGAVALGRGIYVISVRDGRSRKLTSGESDEAPAWSPSGDWIAFDRRVGGTNYDLFAVNARSGKIRRLTRDPAQETNPSWSPDGSRLVFAVQGRNGDWSLITMPWNGSGRKRVARFDGSAQEPVWSPDGTKIAFIEQSLDSAVVAVVDARGGRPRALTRRRLFASRPAWSPDGKTIAFSAQVAGSSGQPAR